MKQKGINWIPIFNNHKGKWVALKEDETTVVASGKTAKTVFNQAKEKGVSVPILLKVPPVSLPYIG